MDKTTVDRIICEYLPKIYRFSVNKAFGYYEAEEICSSIVDEAYKSLLSADEVYSLDTYIWRICEHVYSKYVAEKRSASAYLLTPSLYRRLTTTPSR
ncbi:MAG: hypothetical protein ACOYID_08685 [Eubacteriales bacterium]|jgi:DNA-directed RNA polymerase specialized sigma24 family protein|nr:hypothetical protein [Clostridiales bacterium]